MKIKGCPQGKHCWDYGDCENCTWGKILQKNSRLKKRKKELWQLLRKMYFVLTGDTDEQGLRNWIKEEKRREQNDKNRKAT